MLNFHIIWIYFLVFKRFHNHQYYFLLKKIHLCSFFNLHFLAILWSLIFYLRRIVIIIFMISLKWIIRIIIVIAMIIALILLYIVVIRTIIIWKLLLTVAWSVLSTTIIAKLICTSTCHMTTSLTFLYPKFTFWTLFIFRSFHKFHKLLIFFWHAIQLFILFTWNPVMHLSFTFETIILFTLWTFIITDVLVELESIWTSRSRTPCHIFSIFINKIMYSKLIIFID